ncbi:MAG: hypothetical protein RLZZ437_2024 [Pseudomonadota bacterium]|jgi:aminoglycoside/choline kinase family phosphotransferase
MPDRTAALQTMLQQAGWGTASSAFLAGDASDRSYARLTLGDKTAVLMDAPPGKGDDPATFLAVAAHLCGLGLSAPRMLAQDLTAGYLLLEDFGDAVFARVLLGDPGLEPSLYATAIDALVKLQSGPAMAGLPCLSPQDWAQAAAFAFDHYRAALTDEAADQAPFVQCLTDLIAGHGTGPHVMIQRDFHAENLIWLPGRTGAARAGLLDFQLAQMGHPVYDLISLVQDARRDVQPDTAIQVMHRFCDSTGLSAQACETACAVWGAQRALRIIGIFARLALQSGKTGYLALLPRVWGHLQTNLQHPALQPLQHICAALLPAPTPATLAAIKQKAGNRP